MIITIALLCLLSGLIVFLWKRCRIHWQLRIYNHVKDIPGPPSIPIIGNIIPFIGTLDHMWKMARKFNFEYNGIFKIWAANRCSIFISDPDYVEVLLSSTKNLEKSEPYDFLTNWLGTGLLISFGDKWKSRRRLLTPAFHLNILKQFVNVFEEQSERSVRLIREECNKPSTNVIPLMAEHALCVLCETTMGLKMETNRLAEFIKYKNAIYRFGEIFMGRIRNPIYFAQFLFDLSPMGKETKQLIGTLQNFTKNVIEERVSSWDILEKQLLTSSSGKQLLPMMDILISEMKNGSNIDHNGIREEVDTFMFEGHDTTSMGLSFLLMLLANNPDIQNKILDEQNAIFNGSGRMASYDDLQNMEYLDRCVKESLRMCPPVPVVGRKLDEDIQFGEYTIPAGIYVHVLIYDLHHHPKYWDEPEKFNPDRFLPENSINRHPFVYIPFSAGSRNCIGKRFVMLEMKSFISKVIREYVLEPVDNLNTIVLKTDLVMRPLNDIKIKFRRRL